MQWHLYSDSFVITSKVCLSPRELSSRPQNFTMDLPSEGQCTSLEVNHFEDPETTIMLEFFFIEMLRSRKHGNG